MGTFERPKTASALELPKMRAKAVERSTNHLRLQATSNRTGINAQRQNDYLDSEKPGYWLLSFGQGLVKTAEPNSQNEDGDYANRGTSLGNMSATLRSSLLKKEPEVTERAETYTRFVEVARLASPQLFGELILLDPLRRSGVSLVSETAVDLVVVRKSILQGLQAQFIPGTISELQQSYVTHNPHKERVIQIYKRREAWSKLQQEIIAKEETGKRTKSRSGRNGPERSKHVKGKIPNKRKSMRSTVAS